MKSSKSIITLNILLAAITIIGGVLYNTISHNLPTKCVASGAFVVLGILNLIVVIRQNPTLPFAKTMTAGLFFAMLGDIVLEIVFLYGALIFAVGHVFYFIAYCKLVSLKKADILPGICIFAVAALIILFLPIFDFGSIVMQAVCLFYALIIALMLGKAISNYRRKTALLTKLLLIGSALFFFSDFMLLFDSFADAPRIVNVLCVNTYYPAQALLAHSILRSQGQDHL